MSTSNFPSYSFLFALIPLKNVIILFLFFSSRRSREFPTTAKSVSLSRPARGLIPTTNLPNGFIQLQSLVSVDMKMYTSERAG